MLIAPRFTIVASKKEKERKKKKKKKSSRKASWFRFPSNNSYDSNYIHKSDCEQPGNGVIRRKRKSLSLIPHDWSLKCIFFKWNIKKFTLLHTLLDTYTCTRIPRSHLFLFSRFIYHTMKSAPLFCDRWIGTLSQINLVPP